MSKNKITSSILAAAFIGAMGSAYAQGSAGSANTTPNGMNANATATLPGAKPKCLNAPVNNVPKGCAPDVTSTTTTGTPSDSSADVLKPSADANASVGIAPATMDSSATLKPGTVTPPSVNGSVPKMNGK